MMALSKLSFTKDWKNPSDFPTYEPYETQVRADLQILFDEIKTFLNSLIDTLESGGASANVGVTLGEASMNLQAALNSLYVGQSNRYTKQEVTSLIGEASNNLVENIEYTPNTGVFSIKKKDGTTSTIDTVIEKVPANFELLEESGAYYLKVTNQDGSYSKIDVSTLMQIFDFVASPDISWSVTGEGVTKTVTATVRANSIGPDKLSPDVTTMLENYVAEAESAMNAAVSAKQSAAASQSEAETAAETATARATESATESKKSESYAVGGTGTRTGEDTDNAMYYKQQAALAKADSVAAKNAAISAQSSAETAQSGAEQAKSEAAAARGAAVTAKNDAETARDEAVTARDESVSARDESVSARDEALTAKTAAETAQSTAENARDESVSAKEYSVAAKEAAETAKNESISAKEDAVAAKIAAETARDQAQEIAGGDYATKTELTQGLSTKLSASDIINNLTSGGTSVPLSAEQGKVLKGLIDKLNGDSSEVGSVAYQIAQIVAGADARYDTLKEIADWIISDTTGAAKMASDILALQNEMSNHTHDDRYYTETEIDSKISNINTSLSGKSPLSHAHDDRYYTESEIDSKMSAINTSLSGKAPSSHTHDDRYYTEAEIDSKLDTKAPAYTYGTEDLTAGTSSLETGKLYFVYE